jgi:hypothetical protein
MGYSYALQLPHSTYSDWWNPTVASWAANHGGVSPAFRELTKPFDRPTWWPDGPDFREFMKHIEEQIKMAKKAAAEAKKTSAKAKKGSTTSRAGRRGRTRGGGEAESMAAAAAPQGQTSREGEDVQEEGEADGEGETDHESEPVSGPGRLGGVGTQMEVDRMDTRGEGWVQDEDTGVGVGDGKGKGKGKEVDGGETSRRPTRKAKQQAMVAISAGSSRGATKRKEGPSRQNRDGADAMQLDEGVESDRTSSHDRAIPHGPESSGHLVLPPSVVPADWQARRTLATRTAQDRAAEQLAPEQRPSKKRPAGSGPTETRPSKSRSTPSQTLEQLTPSTNNHSTGDQEVNVTAPQPSQSQPLNAPPSRGTTPNSSATEMIRFPFTQVSTFTCVVVLYHQYMIAFTFISDRLLRHHNPIRTPQ